MVFHNVIIPLWNFKIFTCTCKFVKNNKVFKMENFNLNCKDFEEKCVKFIDNYVRRNEVKCIVLGVSGGIDSAVCAYLLAKVNIRKIFVMMPMNGITPQEDIEDAKEISKILNTETVVTEINPVVEKFKEILNFDERQDKKTTGNLTARVRMCLLYAIANKNNGIVCGTGDKSEILIGYFTKYGDGGCDIIPIADLYKTQVKILAKHLGVPEKITAKKPSPRLWKGQKASDEIGMDYEEIDKILVLMEKGMSKDEISEKTNISAENVGKIFEMNKASGHKRNLPAGFKFF